MPQPVEEERCRGLQGQRVVQAQEEGRLLNASHMELKQAVLPVAGRLLFFLSENVHAVAPLAGQRRDALLVWMSCKPLGERDTALRRGVDPPWPWPLPLNKWAGDEATIDGIRASLWEGNMIRILGAVQQEIAEIVYQDLLEVDQWEFDAAATPTGQHSRRILKCLSWGSGGCPQVLGHFHRFMASQLQFWSKLAGLPLMSWRPLDPSSAAATLYRQGDFMSPHTDLEQGCGLSVIWSLALGWRPEQGGALWWMRHSGAEVFAAAFNTMYMFKPGNVSHHMVSPVVSGEGKRFAVSGCFTAQPV